jgi:hypothetical protein
LQTTTDASASAELSAVVDELLNSLSNKFAGVSSEIFAKSKHWIDRGNFAPRGRYITKRCGREGWERQSYEAVAYKAAGK